MIKIVLICIVYTIYKFAFAIFFIQYIDNK